MINIPAAEPGATEPATTGLPTSKLAPAAPATAGLMKSAPVTTELAGSDTDITDASTDASTEPAVLRLEDLSVEFGTARGPVEAVRGISLSVRPGECLGIVGESGAGKSQAFLAAMGLLPANATVRGKASLGSIALLGRTSAELDQVRGLRVGMVFQDPMTSLTPHITVGDQIAEPLVHHLGVTWREGRLRALALLRRVRVTDPERRMRQYPHELSGGMRQRVMIAIALSCEPTLLIADEPTTALDVTVQAQILSLLADLKRERAMSMVLITHDMGVIAGVADRVAVMQAGRIVEMDSVAAVLKLPRHPYTQRLLSAMPRLEDPPGYATATPTFAAAALGTTTVSPFETVVAPLRTTTVSPFETVVTAPLGMTTVSPFATAATAPLGTKTVSPFGTVVIPPRATVAARSPRTTAASPLEVSDLTVDFTVRGGLFSAHETLRAVDGVSFELAAAEAIGVVGESGSGKSTLARAALQLIRPSAGRVVWMGRPIDGLSARDLKPMRRDVQIVFQDPLASLDPRMTVGEIVSEPLKVHRPELDSGARAAAVAEALGRVKLETALTARYPHELSGGQCQRVGIARAMVLQPRLLICDEPVSALDLTVQTQVVDLLIDLKRETGLSILFVSHNLAVVRRLCERVLVLYLGRMMELAPSASLYARPLHPYTRELISAIPIADPDLQPARLSRTVPGEPPSPLSPPSGCVYRTRCPHAVDVCRESRPQWTNVAGTQEALRAVACHRWDEL